MTTMKPGARTPQKLTRACTSAVADEEQALAAGRVDAPKRSPAPLVGCDEQRVTVEQHGSRGTVNDQSVRNKVGEDFPDVAADQSLQR